ncbi:ABC transporter permease [Staphylococcus sp. ACRSN]|uniref:ABC transporter permease n=1 Tax=Staphylococcus sp. ACRSN TaxID=2918214 RepID=UPI001EF2F6D4|nr:ABC transporter permease [Staphylococcus sp. ACRSN]MCG7338988.1 ABC transporter permease [Staphylococcus sp. ACRSN]
MTQHRYMIPSLLIFSVCAILTYTLVILIACINLFKGYVVDTFYITQFILIMLTIVVAFLGFGVNFWYEQKVLRYIGYSILIILTVTGNIFTLLMFISILRYKKTSELGIYNSWESFVNKMKANKIASVSVVILVFMITVSVMSKYLFDTTLATQNQFDELLKNPSPMHPFGTDDFGRDLFTRIVVGTKLTFFISIISVVISTILGMFLGMIAGYFVKIDNLVMRILDIVFAIPSLLLAVAIIASFGASTTNLIIALSIGNIPSFARTMRANVLEVKRMEYVDAARITGEKTPRILWSYILPNSLSPMIVRFSLNIGVVVLTTSSLSFLGLGVSPEVPEWGNILRTGSNYLETHSNLAIFPGLCIMLLVLAFNFIGDAVRDALDPKIQ